jgi:hypothetical protein
MRGWIGRFILPLVAVTGLLATSVWRAHGASIPLGATLNLNAATRTLTASQLMTGAWRRGNPPYTPGALPYGDPPFSSSGMQWISGYLNTQASFVVNAPQRNYPAFSGLPNEEEIYANADAIALLGGSPFSIVNNQLVIQPRPITATETAALNTSLAGRTWVSGAFVSAPYGQTYGYFSFAAKLPPMMPGLWPAFWLLPTNAQWPPEIDILEALMISGKLTMTTSIHTTEAAWGAAGNQQTVTIPISFDPTTEFHEYGVLVEADYITIFYDRVAVRQVPTPTDIQNQPFYLLCDYGIGGTGSWPGPYTGTASPGPFVISDVAAYSGTITASTATPDTTTRPNRPDTGLHRGSVEGDIGHSKSALGRQ